MTTTTGCVPGVRHRGQPKEGCHRLDWTRHQRDFTTGTRQNCLAAMCGASCCRRMALDLMTVSNRKHSLTSRHTFSRSQWSSGSMSDCSARGPVIESRCGQLCLSHNHCDLQPWARAVCTFPAGPRSTQPSTLRGTVNEYQLSG